MILDFALLYNQRICQRAQPGYDIIACGIVGRRTGHTCAECYLIRNILICAVGIETSEQLIPRANVRHSAFGRLLSPAGA